MDARSTLGGALFAVIHDTLEGGHCLLGRAFRGPFGWASQLEVSAWQGHSFPGSLRSSLWPKLCRCPPERWFLCPG